VAARQVQNLRCKSAPWEAAATASPPHRDWSRVSAAVACPTISRCLSPLARAWEAPPAAIPKYSASHADTPAAINPPKRMPSNGRRERPPKPMSARPTSSGVSAPLDTGFQTTPGRPPMLCRRERRAGSFCRHFSRWFGQVHRRGGISGAAAQVPVACTCARLPAVSSPVKGGRPVSSS